jgi:hypothetical protein
LPDREEGRRSRSAHHLVDLGGELLAGRLGGRRHGHHDPDRPKSPKRQDRRPHAGAGRQAVVDEDHGLASDILHRAVFPVYTLAPRELTSLLVGHLLDRLRCDAEAPDHVVVDNSHITAGDRSHGELVPAWHAQLADDEDVERCLQSGRHLVPDGHTSSGQGEDYDIVTTAIVPEQTCKCTARIPAVAKGTVSHPFGLSLPWFRRTT